MPFKKDRNSRDDKSEKSSRTPKTTPGLSAKSTKYKAGKTESDHIIKKNTFTQKVKAEFKGGFKKSEDTKSFSSEKRSQKSFNREEGKSYTRTIRKSEDGITGKSSVRKPYGERTFENKKPFTDKRFSKENSRSERKVYDDKASEGKKPFGDKSFRDKRTNSGDKRFGNDDTKRTDRKPFERKPFENKSTGEKRPYSEKNILSKRFNDKPFKSRLTDTPKPFEERSYRKDDGKWSSEERLKSNNRSKKASPEKDDGKIRLNRYIANAGICSRRKADELIAAGVVSVNGEAVTELGFKIDPAKDLIRYNGETLKREKMVYVLLNKPKDYITTTDDPQERRTVMSLVEKASRERIYPVGRLDRNTTGLLLMTNDGALAEKLSHPRNNVTKIYQAELNKNLLQGDLNKIAFGLELEDGLIKPDQVSYVAGGSKKEIGIQIHSGKNRIVRRIFEHLGYDVVKLDRVVYAQLTKKDLPRGRWRYLEEKEIIQLKHLIQ
ncbi:MAG: pseudouridine synthase [Daejeonella sp.]